MHTAVLPFVCVLGWGVVVGLWNLVFHVDGGIFSEVIQE